MEILFTGKTGLLSPDFFRAFADDDHCVVYSEAETGSIKGKKVTIFKSETENGLEQVFASFNFERVVHLSRALDGAVSVFDELEKLEKTLYLCKNYRIKQFIYLTTNDLQKQQTDGDKESSRHILLNACEQLCLNFSQEYETNFSILKLPFLYSVAKAENQLQRWAEEAFTKGEIVIQGMPETGTDFLCDEDLGELIWRIVDEPVSQSFHVMEVAGENRVTFREIEQWFAEKIPGIHVVYKNHTTCIPIYCKNKAARTDYGWYPHHSFQEDVGTLLENQKKIERVRRKKQRRQRAFHKRKETFRVASEMVIMFVLSEALSLWTGDNVLLQFLDFRLIFVVMMGTMDGLSAGIIAAILASAGYVRDIIDGTQWQVLFYNVQNWLPFACYLLLGAACGYGRDKHEDDLRYMEEEQGILSKKYEFLNQLYVKVLENKETYNSQIIGYRGSFGKLYAIVKQLNKVLPEQIFFEAVCVLEETLDSSSVAIYTINKYSDFARLNVCSKSLSNDFGKSLKLSDYPQMLQELKADNVFINLDGLENYPAYATPIYREEELVGMILIKYAKNRQMSMEYANKFNIITDLIRESLVRAMEHEERHERYIGNTQMLEPESFEKVLRVKKQMKERQYMDYTLLRLEKGERSVEEIAETVSTLVRNTDTLGQGEDGEIYLLLSQTRVEDMGVVSERMKKNRIEFEVVKG